MITFEGRSKQVGTEMSQKCFLLVEQRRTEGRSAEVGAVENKFNLNPSDIFCPPGVYKLLCMQIEMKK